MEEILKTITDSMNSWLPEFMSGFGGSFVKFLAGQVDSFNQLYHFGSSSQWEQSKLWLAVAHQRVLFLALMVFLLRVTADGIRMYVAREAGESIVSPMVLFRRLAMTIGLMLVVTYLFAYGHHGISYKFATLLKQNVKDVSRLSGTERYLVYDAKPWYPDMGTWLTRFDSQWIQAGGSSVGEVAFRIGVGITVAMGIMTFYIQQALRELELVFAWLVGPIVSLAPLSTDDPLREGAFSAWFKEVMVVSFNQVTTMMILILMYELIDFSNMQISGAVTALALITVGTQGPRVFRQYAWGGNTQAQGIASQFMRKMPW